MKPMVWVSVNKKTGEIAHCRVCSVPKTFSSPPLVVTTNGKVDKSYECFQVEDIPDLAKLEKQALKEKIFLSTLIYRDKRMKKGKDGKWVMGKKKPAVKKEAKE